MCSGSEAGSYLRLIDFVHHSTLGLRVIKKKKRNLEAEVEGREVRALLPNPVFGKAPSGCFLWARYPCEACRS